MFRFALLVLAGIGLGALLFGGAESAAAGVGFLAFIPIFFFLKILFVAMIFGMFARRRYGYSWDRNEGPSPWRWTPPRRRPDSSPERRRSDEDRFEEWHRMSHARDEVDSWVEDVEDTE